MKLTNITLWVIAILFFAGCGKNEVSNPVTSITGKIENPGDYLIEFIVSDSIIIVDLNEDNTFKFETSLLNETGEIDFIHHKLSGSLYVIPGTSLVFNMDYNLPYLSSQFEGESANHNKYLFKKTILQNSSENQSTLFRLSETEYLIKINQFKNAQSQ